MTDPKQVEFADTSESKGCCGAKSEPKIEEAPRPEPANKSGCCCAPKDT